MAVERFWDDKPAPEDEFKAEIEATQKELAELEWRVDSLAGDERSRLRCLTTHFFDSSFECFALPWTVDRPRGGSPAETNISDRAILVKRVRPSSSHPAPDPV